MANPAVAAVSMGMNAAGGLLSGLGAKEEADANAAAYRYKAGIAMLNKQINEQNASWALQSGGIQSMEAGLKARQEIANTKVQQAASNLDVNSGSAKAVRDTQTEVTQFDQNVIKWDSEKAAYGYETKATMDVAEANLDQMAATQSEEAGDIKMVTSFLNAGSSVAGKWMQGKTAGMWG